MHAKFITPAACVINIIMDAPAVFCKPKQIDLQVFLLLQLLMLEYKNESYEPEKWAWHTQNEIA